jgi:hypothetical protein
MRAALFLLCSLLYAHVRVPMCGLSLCGLLFLSYTPTCGFSCAGRLFSRIVPMCGLRLCGLPSFSYVPACIYYYYYYYYYYLLLLLLLLLLFFFFFYYYYYCIFSFLLKLNIPFGSSAPYWRDPRKVLRYFTFRRIIYWFSSFGANIVSCASRYLRRGIFTLRFACVAVFFSRRGICGAVCSRCAALASR